MGLPILPGQRDTSDRTIEPEADEGDRIPRVRLLLDLHPTGRHSQARLIMEAEHDLAVLGHQVCHGDVPTVRLEKPGLTAQGE